MEEVVEQELYVERIAALDLGKAVLEACVRLPHPSRAGRRVQEVRTYPTTTARLLELADWLRCQQVSRVVMESTSSYWKGVYFLLEAEGFDCQVANAREVKNVPGRPKTDKIDAVWLAKVAERGMFRPSLVHPEPIRRLRDFTRYRRSLVRDRSRERQRVEKLLEDAQIKLSSVISDIFGVSGRAMLDALAGGQRDPRVLAELARGSMRGKTSVLVEALTGFFTDHHGELLTMMLDNIDRLTAQITTLETRIEELVAPFWRQVEQLAEIPGIGPIGAAEIIGEIGVDMTRFPSAAHLVLSATEDGPSVAVNTWCPGRSSPRPSTSPPGPRSRRNVRRATRGWPPPLATPPAPRPAPAPSWAPATGASPDDAARARPSSRSATAS
jgi:transposase